MKEPIFDFDVTSMLRKYSSFSKCHILQALVQNAMDENIRTCNIYLKYEEGRAHIKVIDDSQEGFKDFSDIYTLRKKADKSADVTKRGRFNEGLKQVICLCDTVTIISKSGGYHFDMQSRKRMRVNKKRKIGTSVSVVATMSEGEYQGCIYFVQDIIADEKIRLLMKHDSSEYEVSEKLPDASFTMQMPTVLEKNGFQIMVDKETVVNLYHNSPECHKNNLCELGIPICEIRGFFTVDIRQKIPLPIDESYWKAVGNIFKLLCETEGEFLMGGYDCNEIQQKHPTFYHYFFSESN